MSLVIQQELATRFSCSRSLRYLLIFSIDALTIFGATQSLILGARHEDCKVWSVSDYIIMKMSSETVTYLFAITGDRGEDGGIKVGCNLQARLPDLPDFSYPSDLNTD